MAKIKQEREHNVQFAKGGNTSMFSQQQAEPMKSGQTGDPGATGKGAEFAKGGSGKMFGYSAALPAQSGITSPR
jgi:hypothetical protein